MVSRAVGGPLPAPAHVTQLDGSSWAPYGCMGAAAAMAMDAYTRGTIRPGMAAIRAKQDDRDKGIGLDDVATAWRRGWGLTFDHGSPSWSAVRDRLRAGKGAVVTANYRAMGRWRAPGSTFTGPHALYLQRLDGRGGVIVNDPLRRSSTVIPESVVQLAYTGGAGWGSGTYQGGATGSATVGGWGNLVTFPAGHVLTAADVDSIMATLKAAGFFATDVPDPLNVAGGFEGSGAKLTRRVLLGHVGEAWDKSLQDRLQRELGATADLAADPFSSLNLGGLLPVLDELPARAGIVVGAVLLGLLGVWLTFREPSTVVLPSPVRRLTRR